MSEGDSTTFWADVSHHDWNRRGGNLDWAKVRAQTSSVMCARATYGDPAGWNRATHHFGALQSGAAAAGFTVRGGYHNLIRGDANSMMRQADWLSRVLDSQGCNWAMADIERYAELVSAGLWPRWQDVLRFRDAWYTTARPPMSWYLPQWVYNSSGFSGGDLGELPGVFIQSHYAGGDGTLHQIYANAGGDSGTGWDDCFGNRCPDAWQFTAVANVDGASDQTDVNAFRGTFEQLSALLAGGGDDMALGLQDLDPGGNDPDGAQRSVWAWTRDVAHALVFGKPAWKTDAPYPGVPKPWIVERVEAIESKVDSLTVGGIDPNVLRSIIREEVAAVRAGVDADTKDTVLDALTGGAAAVQADEPQ